MAEHQKSDGEIITENIRLRAQIAQLEDKLDHLELHGAAARALQQAEAWHALVLSAVADVVLMSDSAGRITYVSPNAHLVFGHSAGEILRQGRVSYFLPPNLFDADLLEQRGEITNISCQIRDAVGRARDLMITVRRIDLNGASILYACRDVTERNRIQLDYELLALTMERKVEERTQQLRESRDRYRRYVEGLRGEYLFYATDRDGVITFVSPSVHNLLGYTSDQVIGRNWREFISPDHPLLPKLEEFERMRFSGVPTPAFFAAPVRHANGETRMIEFTDAQVRDLDGAVVANEGICRDITQRLVAEEELRRARDELEVRVAQRTAELTATNQQLRESEHRYRTVVEDQLEFIVRWREDGKRTFVNDSYCDHRGAARSELIGNSFLADFAGAGRAELKAKLSRLSSFQPVVLHEQEVVRPDGQAAWERWRHRALFNEGGELIEFQSVGYDATEERKRDHQAQERLNARLHMQNLTDRERDVMRLVVAGDANKVVARKLGLSIKTIEKHRSSFMKKLGVRSVPELVRLAMLADEIGAMVH
jgi:PAS domain S-box-containing protein